MLDLDEINPRLQLDYRTSLPDKSDTAFLSFSESRKRGGRLFKRTVSKANDLKRRFCRSVIKGNMGRVFGADAQKIVLATTNQAPVHRRRQNPLAK